MTIRRFYHLSLFIPILLPWLMKLAGFGYDSGWELLEPVYRQSRYGTALLAVPYLGMAYLACRRMRRTSESEIVRASLRAPFLFAGLACLGFLPIVGGSALTGGSSVLEAGGVLLEVGVLALMRAAGYVLLVNGVLFLGCQARLVRLETRVAFL